MTRPDDLPDLSALSTLDAEAFGALVERRLRAAAAPGPISPNDWLGLVDYATSAHVQPAAQAGRRDEALEWARLAGQVRAFLAARAPDPMGSFERSEMSLRASLIRHLGADPSEPLLDVGRILDWFKGSVDESLRARARAAAGGWAHLPIDEIRALRALKNRISVLELLRQAGVLPDDADVSDWLALHAHLP